MMWLLLGTATTLAGFVLGREFQIYVQRERVARCHRYVEQVRANWEAHQKAVAPFYAAHGIALPWEHKDGDDEDWPETIDAIQ